VSVSEWLHVVARLLPVDGVGGGGGVEAGGQPVQEQLAGEPKDRRQILMCGLEGRPPPPTALVGPSLASLVPRVAAIKETRETKEAESKETVKESRKCEEHEAERKEREREGSKRRGRRQGLTEEGEKEGKRGREGGGGGRRRLEGGGEEPTTASSHARHIPETQDSHQGLPHSHRLQCVPAPLVHLVSDSAHLLSDRHNSTICRQPHRLHTHTGHTRRGVRSVLLDPQHLHHPQSPQFARGSGGSTSGSDHISARPGGREEICDLLSMGWVHSILPGDIVLCAKMAVGELGGRKNHCTNDGLRCGGGQRGGKEAEEKAAVRLSLRQPQKPQLVGV